MPRRKTRRSKGQGSIIKRKDRDNRLVAVVRYTDELGKKRVIKRYVASRTQGDLFIKKTLGEIEQHGTRIIDGERLTFSKLAEIYSERKLVAPVYKGDTKIAGLRSYKEQQTYLKTLVEHFGASRVRFITHSDIEEFKIKRLNTPVKPQEKKRLPKKKPAVVKPPRQRAIASVNRELALLRSILNFAKRSGWITRSPFEMGDPLIETANETKRERILTRDEEDSLLSFCKGPRAHLKPVIICALDTAMRQSEIFQLKWSDVDLDAGLIRVRATTTKTRKARTIGLTTRLQMELARLYAMAPNDPDGLVFGISDNVKRSFVGACRDAELEDFRFHDMRHTAITRMIQAGMPAMEVMKVSGHTQMQTFARYVNTDGHAAKRAASALDAWQQISEPMLKTATEFIN